MTGNIVTSHCSPRQADMAGRALLAFAAAVALLVLHWLARRSATELPPVEPLAKRFWGKGRGTRLRFRVGRRKGAPRAATNESRSDRPLARATTRVDDRPQVSPNETASRCHLDGTETGGGCSGQACLLVPASAAVAQLANGASVARPRAWRVRRRSNRLTAPSPLDSSATRHTTRVLSTAHHTARLRWTRGDGRPPRWAGM